MKKVLWYVIYWRRKKWYSENHKKILSNFTLNLSSILNQFNLQEEEKERLILKQEIY